MSYDKPTPGEIAEFGDPASNDVVTGAVLNIPVEVDFDDGGEVGDDDGESD